ncbi:MAG: transferase [Planctomycetota bacterium]
MTKTATTTSIDTARVQGADPAPAETTGDALPVHATGGVNQNPADVGFFALLREDLRTHDGKLFEQGFWAIAVHRYGNWRMGIKPKLLRLPFSLVYKILNKHVEWLCGISLPDTVKVGRRVRLWHHGGMILHAASIGDGAQIRQNTTFGVVRTEHNFEMPVIGARADIGCGACVLGPVTVGEGSVVGANAVVLKDVPAHSVAVGIPAKIIKTLDPSDPADNAEGAA